MTEPHKKLLADDEAVAFVRKFKLSLAKNWSYTKADSIWGMADLACFLWALKRPLDTLVIARSVANEIPSPPPLKGGRFNFNIWSPATRLHSLLVHLETDKDRAEFSRTALLNEPGYARDNPDYLQQLVNNARSLTSVQLGLESQKWECVNLSRSINCMVLFWEVAAAGDSLFTPYAADTDKLIAQLLPKLAERLMDKK
jgi:hypothetical protein